MGHADSGDRALFSSKRFLAALPTDRSLRVITINRSGADEIARNSAEKVSVPPTAESVVFDTEIGSRFAELL